MKVKVERFTHDTLSYISSFFSSFDRNFKMFNSKRILSSDIYITLISAYSICSDQHSFQYTVRVTLQDTSIHKSTGISFIRVTDDIFFITLFLTGKFPFQSGREAGTTFSS